MGLFDIFKKKARPASSTSEAGSDDAPPALGWDAITRAFEAVYPEQTNPVHRAPLVYRMYDLSENAAAFDGISAYDAGDHWHFVTFGLTELYTKENPDLAVSGFGYEFTFKLPKPSEATAALGIRLPGSDREIGVERSGARPRAHHQDRAARRSGEHARDLRARRPRSVVSRATRDSERASRAALAARSRGPASAARPRRPPGARFRRRLGERGRHGPPSTEPTPRDADPDPRRLGLPSLRPATIAEEHSRTGGVELLVGRRHLWVASALVLSCGPSAFPARQTAQPNPAPLVTTDRSTPPSAYPIFWNGTAVSTALTPDEQRVTAIATARWSSCALLEDASVWCWGEGQSVNDRPSPDPARRRRSDHRRGGALLRARQGRVGVLLGLSAARPGRVP